VMAVQSEVTDMGNYMELTHGVDASVDLIIWPEYGLPRDIRRDPRAMGKLVDLAQQRNAVMVVGTQTHLEGKQWYNTALTFDGDGELGDHYKNHTVHFFDDGTAGTEARSVDTRLGKVGTPICFDCDYEDVIRRMTAAGAEFFAVPSMDAQHWSTREHVQHGELFRHRAAENGRWMAVSSTSGVTQIIDPYGNRTGEIPLMDDGVLMGEIGKIQSKTIYTRGGWLFPWLAMVVGACWVVVMFFQFVFEHRRQRHTNG
jgi:apolipoprotein N-acyltransferase